MEQWSTESRKFSLNFAHLLVQKTCTTLLTNQNQSRFGRWRFPALSGSLVSFTLSFLWLLEVYSSLLIGRWNYFSLGFTTLDRKVL